MKKIYCISCEIKGKKRRKEGVVPVKDYTSGEVVYMCEECSEEWEQLQQLQLIIKDNGSTNTED